jgi:hypothetical protein
MRMIASIGCIALAGCGHHPKPGESVAEVCRVANDHKDVFVSGYLNPPMLMIGCEKSCVIELVPKTSERYGLSLFFAVGTVPRTMAPVHAGGGGFPGEVEELPADALRLVTDDGKVVTPGDIVRVHGTVEVEDDRGTIQCSMHQPTSVVAL